MRKIQFAKTPLDLDSQLRKLVATCQPSEKYELGELLLKCSYYRIKSYLQPLRDPQHGTVREESARSREGFIVTYKMECTMPPLSASHFAPDASLPPSWMMIEICSFRFFSRLYKALKTAYRKGIAQVFSLDEQIVSSWFHALSVTRNICAHHARIWNRTLGVTPKTPNRDELFGAGDSSKVSVILLILLRLLQTVEENSASQKKVIAFITGSSEYFQCKMGFYPKQIHRIHQL